MRVSFDGEVEFGGDEDEGERRKDCTARRQVGLEREMAKREFSVLGGVLGMREYVMTGSQLGSFSSAWAHGWVKSE